MGDMAGLVRRTHITSAGVAGLLALSAAIYAGTDVAAAFLVGVFVGFVMFGGLAVIVERTVRPEWERPARRWPYTVLHIGRFAVAGAAMYGVARWQIRLLPCVAAGYMLPTAVLVLKVVGKELNRRLGVDRSGRDRGGDESLTQ